MQNLPTTPSSYAYQPQQSHLNVSRVPQHNNQVLRSNSLTNSQAKPLQNQSLNSSIAYPAQILSQKNIPVSLNESKINDLQLQAQQLQQAQQQAQQQAHLQLQTQLQQQSQLQQPSLLVSRVQIPSQTQIIIAPEIGTYGSAMKKPN